MKTAPLGARFFYALGAIAGRVLRPARAGGAAPQAFASKGFPPGYLS